MDNKPKMSGYIIGFDPINANMPKSKAFVTKKPNGDYPKIEAEWEEGEYNQVPLKVTEHVFNVHLLQSCTDELNKGSFKTFFGHGYYTKGLFWFRFKHNNKGFHIKNTKLHPETFSERMKIKGSGFSIGNWHLKWLKRYEG